MDVDTTFASTQGNDGPSLPDDKKPFDDKPIDKNTTIPIDPIVDKNPTEECPPYNFKPNEDYLICISTICIMFPASDGSLTFLDLDGHCT